MSDEIEQKYSLMYEMLPNTSPKVDVAQDVKFLDPSCHVEISESDRKAVNTEMKEIPFDAPIEPEPIIQPGVDPLRKINLLSRKIIKEARAKRKMLPHELLLYWANGVPLGGLTPTPAQQIYAAVSAAPYYAPKLANVEIKQDVRVRAVISAQPMTPEQWAAKYIDNDSSNNTKVVEAERIDDDTL
jgi:hypothetical protein